METKHSPTPWHRNVRPASHYPIIFSGRNTHVCQIVSRGLTEETIEANCDFLVRAVNCHGELTAALKWFLRRYNAGLSEKALAQLAFVFAEVAHAALAKAKGGTT
jgi:hypothetical protein